MIYSKPLWHEIKSLIILILKIVYVKNVYIRNVNNVTIYILIYYVDSNLIWSFSPKELSNIRHQ